MRAVVIAALMALAACGQQAPASFDGSSQQAFDASLAEVRASLGPARRAKFEAALTLARAETFGAANDREDYKAKLRERLDGKSADALIADAAAKGQDAGRRLADGAFDAKRQLNEGIGELKAVTGEKNQQ